VFIALRDNVFDETKYVTRSDIVLFSELREGQLGDPEVVPTMTRTKC
jgi:hypothetical protein